MVQQLNDDPNNIEIVNRLECKICINTYRMFFVENSEDYFHRRGSSLTPEQLFKIRKSKKDKLTKFLDGNSGWKQDKTQESEALAQKCTSYFLGESGQTQRIENTEASGARFCKYITEKPTTSAPAASPRPSSQPPSASTSPQKKKGALN